jgi:hypothetical protein
MVTRLLCLTGLMSMMLLAASCAELNAQLEITQKEQDKLIAKCEERGGFANVDIRVDHSKLPPRKLFKSCSLPCSQQSVER